MWIYEGMACLRSALLKELGVMEEILPDVACSILFISLHRDAKQEFPEAR